MPTREVFQKFTLNWGFINGPKPLPQVVVSQDGSTCIGIIKTIMYLPGKCPKGNTFKEVHYEQTLSQTIAFNL